MFGGTGTGRNHGAVLIHLPQQEVWTKGKFKFFHNIKVTHPVLSLTRGVIGEGLPSVRRGCVPFCKMPEERVRPRIPVSPSDRQRLNLSRLQMRASGKEPSGIRTGNSGFGRLLQAGRKLAREVALAPHTQQAL